MTKGAKEGFLVGRVKVRGFFEGWRLFSSPKVYGHERGGNDESAGAA